MLIKILSRGSLPTLDNAYKCTPEGGHIQVIINHEHCIIENSGPGISVDDLNNIWTKFSKHQNSGGFGVGLYLTKQLVEKLNRTITVESEPQCFTRFSIFFGPGTL